VSWFAPRASATDNDRIKYAVTTYGGAYVSMSWQGSSGGSSYYNATTHAYYYNGSSSANHGVVVVGWDDNYAAGNFATRPAGNGAFIVKNSWGSGWGDNGYFYVSYYDTVFGCTSNAATFEGAQPVTNYDAVYQYDPLGDVSDVGTGSTTTFWGANKFTAAKDSKLSAVGFYAEAPNTAYEVWEGPSLTSLSKVATGTQTNMGYHTVTVPAGISLTSGSAFVVAVKLTTPGYNYPVAFEYPVSGYSSAATASSGQSYYSSNGTSWTDLTSWTANANVCLKAYTTDATPNSTITVNTPGAGASWHPGEQETVSWTLGSAVSGGSFFVLLYDPVTYTYYVFDAAKAAGAGTIYSDTQTLAGVPPGSYKVRVWYVDGAGTFQYYGDQTGSVSVS
jgi:hypothetical protein